MHPELRRRPVHRKQRKFHCGPFIRPSDPLRDGLIESPDIRHILKRNAQIVLIQVPAQLKAIYLGDVAMAQNPKPQTLALVGADAEFPRNAMEGVRNIAKKAGIKIVYDKTYPPTTADYTPIVRAIAATNPDMFFACSYPPDSVGIIRASSEIGFKPKIYGGGMVGPQATAIKTQLGPLLNGIVVYDFWLPWAKFASDEGREFLKKYQAKAAGAGVDILGYYLPPYAYARMQLIAQAVTATGGTNDEKLAEYCRKTTFKTVVGDIKFNEEGEWAEPQVLAVQFQGVSGNGIDQFKDAKTEVILWPKKYATGKIIYPYNPGS